MPQIDTSAAILACITAGISTITWLVLLVLTVKQRQVRWRVVAIYVLSALVSGWITIGYVYIILEQPFDPVSAFRPVMPVLLALFTSFGVSAYQHDARSATLEQLQRQLDELERKIEQYHTSLHYDT